MAAPQMDAVTSFMHLVENVPVWLEQVRAISTYTKEKNAEFIAEYSRLVQAIRPKRVKSPSMCSIRSDKSRSVQLPDIDPAKEAALETPEPELIDPLTAGNRYLYADQTAAQRKRKSNASMRSGASGPQKFRSKHQTVIHYDGYVQEQLDNMFKAIGVARNNLRKGKNALIVSRGFRLPNLSKRHEALTTPSIENIRSISKYRMGGTGPPGAKFSLRQNSQQPQDGDEAAFLECDKVLEQVQTLCETAAHQFLRDGDCLKELNSADTNLTALIDVVQKTADSLKEKAKQQQEAEEAASAAQSDDAEGNRSHSVSDLDCPSLLTDKSSIEPLNAHQHSISPKPPELPSLTSTLEGMKTRPILPSVGTPLSAPAACMPTAGMTIEVDDGSDDGSSLEEQIDLSQFRSTNRMRMRPG